METLRMLRILSLDFRLRESFKMRSRHLEDELALAKGEILRLRRQISTSRSQKTKTLPRTNAAPEISQGLGAPREAAGSARDGGRRLAWARRGRQPNLGAAVEAAGPGRSGSSGAAGGAASPVRGGGGGGGGVWRRRIRRRRRPDGAAEAG
ncbi:hypothetical protein GUJ93_ZPchr0009g1785 [Zizania palustris]|uniref:Uncharacterized protein n=1 Tax=Zizania palustris TaxID=103762 RepID=A0A8J5S777_ZIZPA|nr:hypothetical protein GUJ93_ZPchr0009g1785 [Zizania palustris]